MQLDSVEIMSRISKKIKKDESWFRIDKDNPPDTVEKANNFIDLTEDIEGLGYEYAGTCTSENASTPKEVKGKIERIIQSVPVNKHFNVYCSFHKKELEPTGLFGIEYWGFAFIIGTDWPNDKIMIRMVLQPSEDKQQIDSTAKKYGLQWFGDVDQPIPYRIVTPTKKTFFDFARDTFNFFTELGIGRV